MKIFGNQCIEEQSALFHIPIFTSKSKMNAKNKLVGRLLEFDSFLTSLFIITHMKKL